MSTYRASCWSITINNPTEEDTRCDVPGWKLSGQYEEGEEGTRHFQGMLITPQVRFSAVKRVFPRAHIEIARNRQALEKYTTKEETRVATYEATGVPSLFQYQDNICKAFDRDEYNRRCQDPKYYHLYKGDNSEILLNYVDELIAEDIRAGMRGIEFIAVNPMWRSSWKKYGRSIIERYASSRPPEQTPPSPSPPLDCDRSPCTVTACGQSSADIH